MKKLMFLGMLLLVSHVRAQEQQQLSGHRGAGHRGAFNQINYIQVNESQIVNTKSRNFEELVQQMNQVGNQVVRIKNKPTWIAHSPELNLQTIVVVTKENHTPKTETSLLGHIELPSPKPVGVKTTRILKTQSVKTPVKAESTYKFQRERKSFRKKIILPFYRWTRKTFPRKTKSKGVRMTCYF